MAIDTRRRVAELEGRNSLSPERTAQVRKHLSACRFQLSISDSVLAGILANTMRQVITDAVDTMAVTLAADGFNMFMANGEFTEKLRDEPDVDQYQAKFVLAHEAYHLLLLHLYADEEHRKDEAWTMACEASINRRVSKLLKTGLPQIDGQATGVDPDKLYDQYRRDLKKQGIEPVSKDQFFETDLGCYMELKRMSRPPTPPPSNVQICLHGSGAGASGNGQPCTCPSDQEGDEQSDQDGSGQRSGDEQSDDANGSGSGGGKPDPNCPAHGAGAGAGHLDKSEVSRVVDEALQVAINEAINGNDRARKELLDLADGAAGSESASKMFGNLGLGALRGETVSTRRTDYWQQWVEQRLADRLEPGLRLQRQRKIWWEETFRYNGDEPNMVIDIFVDASGSMRTSDLEWIAAKVGDTDGLEIRWHSFDAQIWDFEVGEPIRGGGGTSFSIIDDYVNESDEEEPDAILVVTDGYAPHITPDDPDKWVWLITPGGDTWPLDHTTPMDCWEIDTSDALAAA